MPPDRELRRMVVDLASLRPDDVEAVLDKLDPSQRKKVEVLLREFSAFGFGGSAAPHSARADAIDGARVSSWLLGRTDPDCAEARMTPLARSTLREAALRLYPAPQEDANRTGPSLLGRLKSLLWTGDTA
jgi:hypothetical protein